MKVLMCQPHNDNIYYKSALAFDDAAADLGLNEVFRPRSSLLAYAFNLGFAKALNDEVDFFVMLHADIEPTAGWARQLLSDMQRADLDVIHAPVRLKDTSGCTSTAVAYESDSWATRRRLTAKEIDRLPEAFTIEDIREEIDPDALMLLPNTGCHAIRIGDWCRDWCYTVQDTIRCVNGKWEARTLPEDWKLGFDAWRLGLRVGGTKSVGTRHHGTGTYNSNSITGCDIDPLFERNQELALTGD